jgi:hypothetical protein
VALTNAGFVLDYQILADKTGMPITGFATTAAIEPPKTGDEEDPKKKS